MDREQLLHRRSRKYKEKYPKNKVYWDEEAFYSEEQKIIRKSEWSTPYLVLAGSGILIALAWIFLVYSWQDYYNQMLNFTFTQNLTVDGDVVVQGNVIVDNDTIVLGDIITDEIIESSNITGDQGPMVILI